MAERRMFAKSIIDSDAFLDMPMSARLLYYDLSMRADDDGFNNSPKKVMRTIGATVDDINILIARKFIIPFDNGVVVIKHWLIHNYIRKDTYKETPYKEEKALLEFDENNSYRLTDTSRRRAVDEPLTQDRLGKDRLELGEDNINNSTPTATKPPKHKYGTHKNVLLTDDEYEKLKERFPDDYDEKINTLSEGLALKGYKYKSHYLAVIKWAQNEKPKATKTTASSNPFLDLLKEGEI